MPLLCNSLDTTKRETRRGKLRFSCSSCSKNYQIKRTRKFDKKKLLIQHLDELPFRKLAELNNISITTAYIYCMEELEKLPHCVDVTRKYCNRFCGILLVDGKYLKVKGYDKKIPVIYGIDYLTHDIPTYTLAPSENYLACLKLFKSFRLVNYTLQSLVSDDNSNIYEACKQIYPNVVRQLCTNHYKENIRKLLNIKTDNTYIDFMKSIETLFKNQRSSDDFNRVTSSKVSAPPRLKWWA